MEIDGKQFENCIFRNATLLFSGRAPTTFIKSPFEGRMILETNHPVAKTYAKLSYELRTRYVVEEGEKDITGTIHFKSREEKKPASDKAGSPP